MSSRQSSLERYRYPLYIAGLLLTSYVAYEFYQHTSHSSHHRLRRSNARRRGSSHPTARRPRPLGLSSRSSRASLIPVDAGAGHELQDIIQPGELLTDLAIPDTVADALTETGHAAQEARGAGNVGSGGVDGREGRAARRSSDRESEFSFAPPDTKESIENQNLLTLLYTIAQDQAQKDSYVHRGVTCNNCQTLPIRGIRYRCANCLDFDLCEECESLASAHPQTHLFYKIRIPAPFIGNSRHAQIPCYPGKPQMLPISLRQETLQHLQEITIFEQAELEALYEQFKCLAASDYNDAPFGINGAISRDTFDKCFLPNAHVHPASPNLIYDRMFNFYDTNQDGLISFEEFVMGVSYTSSKARNPKLYLQKLFQGYDLDGDGYVERKDFLRMFKAYYALSKDLVKESVASLGDELYDPQHMDNVLLGRGPISAAFTTTIQPPSRTWNKPERDPDEDDDSDHPAILHNDTDRMDPAEFAREMREAARKKREESGEEPPDGKAREIEDRRQTEFWGLDDETGIELPDEERDVGSEVLFQMALRGINELLDTFFGAQEKAAVEEAARREEGATSTNGSGKGKKAGLPPGKLSFEEFEKIMTGDQAKNLGFVKVWTDLASF